MSSSLRSPSQIDVRSKFLRVVRSVPENSVDVETQGAKFGPSGAPILECKPNSVSLYPLLAPTVLIDQITEIITTAGNDPQIIAGDSALDFIFKDMGRTITVFDTSGNHISTYCECQRIGDSVYEGVMNEILYNATYLVRTWAASGLNVAVARLG